MAGPDFDYIRKVYGKNIDNIDDAAEAVIATINDCSDNRVLGFKWEVGYHDRVPNTHSAPEEHRHNFRCKGEVPNGFSGFYGRVWIRMEKEPPFMTDKFARTNTHSGTGGYGPYSGPWTTLGSRWYNRYSDKPPFNAYPRPNFYSYDYRFYMLDWPELVLDLESAMIMDKLAGVPQREFNHTFLWQDNDTVAKDSEFINECKKVKVMS
jgi:hypothetical protein